MKNEIIIDMPLRIQNDKDGFEFLINDLYYATKDIKNSIITLNFKKTRWLEANLTAILGAIFSVIKNNKNRIIISSINNSIGKVLLKNNFLNSFGIEMDIVDTYESTIKYTKFTPNERVRFQEYLKSEFIPKINLLMSTSFEKELRLNLEEVFQNARTHGKCEYIFVCGQYFYVNKKVKFTIVDLGRSIPENVKSKINSEINDEDAIDWATKDGNSTKVDVSGGIGLYQLSEFLKVNGGKLQIISSHGYWEQDKNCISKLRLNKPFYGTIVNIEVVINSKVYLSQEEVNNYIKDIF